MREIIKNKKITGFLILVFICCLGIAGTILAIQRHGKNQKGILLAFDDYSAETWEAAFDLFDKYDAKVTFFICATEPTSFCDNAIARGHEIGYHTAGHKNLIGLDKSEFYEQAIAPLEVFEAAGYQLTSFAYPQGAYEDWMNEELLKYYDTLRGAYHYRGVYKKDVKGGFIESRSLDNINYESDEDYQNKVINMLDGLAACDDGTVVSMYSHAIADGSWAITPDRLEFLLREAKKRHFKFYTFQDLQ